MGELRDFVYIDDVSLNSNLSSLGRGVPAEITESSEDETEKSGEAGGTLWGIGAKGRYGNFDRSAIETKLEITAPYRFQDLNNALNEHDIEVYENPDPRSLARGDVVRIEGKAKPMSLFKFEVTIKTIREFVNSRVQESLSDIGEDPEMDDGTDLDELQSFEDLIELFTGDKVPLRMEAKDEDWAYGVALDRENMRMIPSQAFVDEQEYVLFGRVDKRITRGDSWDPILVTRILDRYVPEDTDTETIREDLEGLANEMNMSMEPDDWELPGHTATIRPIAMFW